MGLRDQKKIDDDTHRSVIWLGFKRLTADNAEKLSRLSAMTALLPR